MAESMFDKEFQKKSDELAKYIDRKARQFRSLHFGCDLKEIKEFICILFKNAPSMKPIVNKRFIEEWYPAINYLAHSDEAKEEHKEILGRMLRAAGMEVK